MFTSEQLERYHRQMMLEDIGTAGQEKLGQAKVLIVGVGGLGSPLALYLTAAGVGTVGLADGDVVDRSNLQRQVVHFTPDLDRPKVESAREKLRQLNPDVKVNVHPGWITADNIMETIAGYDFIVDATDSPATKFLINDACVLGAKPFSHGGILAFRGQTLTHVPGTACYRCIFRSFPRGADTLGKQGVLGAVPGILGSIQAAETLKYLLGVGQLATNQLLTFNILTAAFRSIPILRDPKCPVCGSNPSIKEIGQAC